MLEYLHDRTEASYLVTELAARIFEEESDVLSKLRYIRRTIVFAKDAVAVEDAQELRLLMLSPDSAKYFQGAQFSLHDGSYLAVAAKNTESQLSTVTSYVSLLRFRGQQKLGNYPNQHEHDRNEKTHL